MASSDLTPQPTSPAPRRDVQAALATLIATPPRPAPPQAAAAQETPPALPRRRILVPCRDEVYGY